MEACFQYRSDSSCSYTKRRRQLLYQTIQTFSLFFILQNRMRFQRCKEKSKPIFSWQHFLIQINLSSIVQLPHQNYRKTKQKQNRHTLTNTNLTLKLMLKHQQVKQQHVRAGWKSEVVFLHLITPTITMQRRWTCSMQCEVRKNITIFQDC